MTLNLTNNLLHNKRNLLNKYGTLAKYKFISNISTVSGFLLDKKKNSCLVQVQSQSQHWLKQLKKLISTSWLHHKLCIVFYPTGIFCLLMCRYFRKTCSFFNSRALITCFDTKHFLQVQGLSVYIFFGIKCVLSENSC